MNNLQSKYEYLRRIHAVQDYIEAHLYDDLSLEKLAAAAGFSKYHFHRIFKGIVREPLSQYINRLKLERAAYLLGKREDLNITDIAYQLGFSDSAVFSRAFRNHFGMSPRKYRKDFRKNCKESFALSQYNEGVTKNRDRTTSVHGEIKLLNKEEVKVAYIRYMGSYKNLAAAFSGLLEKMYQYAASHHIPKEQVTLLAIYHDNPEFTEADRLRTSLCMKVPDGACEDVENEIGVMSIPAGKYVVGHFNVSVEECSQAWDYMYEEWLLGSGYLPGVSYPFEVYQNDPYKSKDHKCFVDIYLPVEPIQ